MNSDAEEAVEETEEEEEEAAAERGADSLLSQSARQIQAVDQQQTQEHPGAVTDGRMHQCLPNCADRRKE